MDLTLEKTRATSVPSSRSFLSRTFPRRGQEENDGPKGPLGLTTLHDPGSDHEVIVDIIFVHGLNGGSQSTWSKGNKLSHFWPKEWLPVDDAFQDARIHTFGYPSDISRESILNVHDFARSLLAAVKDSPAINRGDKPRLIFVAHSMGGLVVKRAYILGHREPEFQTVVESICSIFFLATPHQGAAIAQTLARLIALVPGARPFADDLLPQSPLVQSINEEFPRICGKLQLMSFYETRPMTVGVNKILIVEKTSAVMNLTNERRTLLDADHRNVAMYASPNDSSFVAVRNALATVVSLQRDFSRSHKQLVAHEDQIGLNRSLSISDAPEDDIMTHDSVRFPGSCEWLTGKEYYKSWRESMDSRFLWLRGRPGAGKSVLSSYIINDLRDKGLDCCFFFFQASDNAKSTVSMCLRSMAWQMAMLHPDVFAKIRELMAHWKDVPIDKIDSNPVWRKIYLSGILKVRLNRPQFWVIDAMDECKDSTSMVNFLARIQEHWPLSILVTCRDPVEAHLSNVSHRVDIRCHIISDEDSKQDISLFLKSNIKFLPHPASAKWPTPWEMASDIVQNSGGCFLWASLIFSELREVTSGKEIEQVLGSIPSDMDALYSKILLDMGSARFGKDLAKAFITWSTYAFRPLTTAEIQAPIEADLNDKIDDVERAISKCCGNLVYVDTYNKVRLVHATAREFLIRKGVESEFTVRRAEAHRRLAMVCFQFLMQSDKNASKPRRLGSDPEVRTTRSSSMANLAPFTDYASTFLFQHLNQVHSTDNEVFVMLSKFLGSTSLLRWIEYIATSGDLYTIYQAGKTINSLLSRRAQHSPPVGLARGQKRFAMLEKWGDDLTHLVTRFSSWLRLSPQSIYHLIPPFCPPDSAIKQQFSNQFRGLYVQGLSARRWDDCLTTITYSKNMKPNVVAAGLGFFAVGMMDPSGQIKVYGDSIFQEIHVLNHGEPVWRLAFAESGKFIASSGAKMVRIWSCTNGAELMSFKIPSFCMALAFADEDSTLRVATKQNELIEWDMESQAFFRDEPATWTADLEEAMQFRTPTLLALGSASGLLLVIYRGEDIVLWDYIEDRIYDVYEKDTGSVSTYGSHKLARGVTTVRAATFSYAVDTNWLAATYSDGDLLVYDTILGKPIAVAESANTMLLASSHDGRTLAGVDSLGNLTLFEFETLRPLYRVQFDTRILPKGLAFTSDSLRFIEIRGEQCRVWEPAILRRTDVLDEDNSDTISVSTGPQEIDYQTSGALTITAIACGKASSVVFYAMEDGSVHAYDISGEPESQSLFVQNLRCSINLLYLDEESSVLACGDHGGRVTARKVARLNVPRQQPSWDIHSQPLIDTRPPEHSRLMQILASGNHSRLLVSTEKYDTLWPMPKQGESVWITRLERHGSHYWLAQPSGSEYLFRIENSEFGIYKWSSLERVRSIQISSNGNFGQLVSLSHPQFFVTVSKMAPETGQNGHTSIQLWDFNELENSSGPVAPANQLNSLSSNIQLIIGTFGTRMVFYTTDCWIASVGLGPSLENSFVRHFLVPSDWINVFHRLIIGIGRGGEILFAKQSELAVIKRGLEVTESGGSFNPRRGSNQLQRGGSNPIQHRGLSPAATGPLADQRVSPR